MHPIAFTVGNLEVRWYGILIAAGIMADTYAAVRRARQMAPGEGYDEHVHALAFWAVAAAVAGKCCSRGPMMPPTRCRHSSSGREACPSTERCWAAPWPAISMPAGTASASGAAPGTPDYAVLYSAARFGLEFLRADSLRILGLKAAQETSLALLYLARRSQANTAA